MAEKVKILVVDDEFSNRLLFEEILLDYALKTVDCGDEMWQCLQTFIPDIILMDINMPGDNGFVLAQKLGEHELYKSIPVIFITARIDGQDVKTAFGLGADDYIKKPFQADEVLSRIEYVLGKKKAEKQLRHNTLTANKIIDSMSDGLLLVNSDGNIIQINKALLTLLNVDTQTNIIGKQIDCLFCNQSISLQIKDINQSLQIEAELCLENKTRIPVRLSVSSVYDNQTNEQCFICLVYDITKQKQTEQNLILAKQKAEQADKLKSVFLANMSHEIRTPLNSIVGFSELLLDSEIPMNDKNDFVKIIHSNCEKLIVFIDNLLDISQIEAGHVTANMAQCEINELLDQLHSIICNLKKQKNKLDIEIFLTKASEERFTIITDSIRLQQILINLLTNALKYTKAGSITFGYTIDNQQSRIKFYVKDTGMGIPTDKINNIFDRFCRIETRGRENIEGAGLGLSISKNLSDLLGGTITVESELGVGTTFYFELPITPADLPLLK